MNGYDRTWPTAIVAIGVGAALGWAVFGNRAMVPDLGLRSARIHFDANERPHLAPVVRVAPTPRGYFDRPRQIEVLAELDPDGLLELLRTGEHALDRRNAAVLLGAHPVPERVMGALMIALRTDQSPEVRFKSAESLGHMAAGDAVGPLHLAATLDSDSRVREAAVAALGEVAEKQSIPILAEVLSSDPSEHVRARAARSLAAIGDRGAWDAIAPGRLRSERSVVVRLAIREAARSLGR